MTGRLASFNPQEARALIKHRGEERWIDRPTKSTAQSSQDRVYYKIIGIAYFVEVVGAATGHGEMCSITKG